MFLWCCHLLLVTVSPAVTHGAVLVFQAGFPAKCRVPSPPWVLQIDIYRHGLENVIYAKEIIGMILLLKAFLVIFLVLFLLGSLIRV